MKSGYGIDCTSMYTPDFYLDLSDLEKNRTGTNNSYNGLVQKTMSICPPDEDIITMGVNAAQKIINNDNRDKIKLILFCTESSFDQSKSAGTYIKHFLNIPDDCTILEVKQACYSATGAIQLAKTFIKGQDGDEDAQALIIASDVAKYEKGSSGEKTQGCGAVAITIAKNPSILDIEDYRGVFSDHTMDFWRPYYSQTAKVSSTYSVKNYIDVLKKCWLRYKEKSNLSFDDIDYFCYHTPFSPMIQRVHNIFCNVINHRKYRVEEVLEQITPPLQYNCQIGNAYTASLYISLTSLLENLNDNASEKRIGLFSYGSGCVAEYFSGIVCPNYKKHLDSSNNQTMIKNRKKVTVEEYEKTHYFKYFNDSNNSEIEKYSYNKNILRLHSIKNHIREYKFND